MKIAYFDCFAGVAGDMILGALLDLGLSQEVLERELGKLSLHGYRMQVSQVNKLGVTATKFDVLLTDSNGERPADSEYQEVTHHHDHGHQHADKPGHHHHHDGGHQHDDKSGHHQHRALSEILQLIRESELDPAVKAIAIRTFLRLGEAEAKVHGVPVEAIHFHEVGGVDAIVDVVGCAIGFHSLGIEKVYASAVHLGQGMVKMAHGLYPIPGPATANLLVGVPTYQSEIRGELTTPTGAAILTAMASGYGPMPAMQIGAIGYGAGTKDRAIPNVLRVILGEPSAQAQAQTGGANLGTNPAQHHTPVMPGGYHQGTAVMIESNIDDMNPQFFDYLFERLTQAGAMDVYLSQVQMKKNRPATVLHVLTASDRVDAALTVIFTETTTIGVRTYAVTKRMLQREMKSVQTPYGTIRVKVARMGEQIVNVKPEYDDCKAAASRTGTPLKLVDETARTLATRPD